MEGLSVSDRRDTSGRKSNDVEGQAKTACRRGGSINATEEVGSGWSPFSQKGWPGLWQDRKELQLPSTMFIHVGGNYE